jgi:hypothetical protein
VDEGSSSNRAALSNTSLDSQSSYEDDRGREYGGDLPDLVVERIGEY